MALFVFQAKAADGKFVKGEVDATSEHEARVKIRAQQLVPLKVLPKLQGAEKPRAENFLDKLLAKKVKPKELQVFTRQFAVLVGAGVPIVQSLEAMIGGGKTSVMNVALQDVVDNVGRGKRLEEAMRRHPAIFDKMYTNLIRAGEEGGVLDEVLNRLAIYIEKSVKLKGRVTKALWYPAAIIVVAGLVIVGILVFVIPKFQQMFKDANRELPALTQMVINASEWFQSYWYVAFGILFMIPVLIKAYYGTPEGKRAIDTLMISVPIFGPLVKMGAIARFSRTLATLLSAGVRIIDSLDIAASTAGNWVIEDTLMKSKDSISRGRSVSEPLKKSKYIPDMVSQMISVGEQTGNIDSMLGKIADFYEDEVEGSADAMTSMIEPLLMVFLGGIIAVLVVAMYLPIFDLAGSVG